MTDLFTPLRLGAVEINNRVLMAPLTRCRAEGEHVPTALMAEYYAQRASAGLVIAEATMILPGNSAFWHEPGIYSAARYMTASLWGCGLLRRRWQWRWERRGSRRH